jgi:hypothetical protein
VHVQVDAVQQILIIAGEAKYILKKKEEEDRAIVVLERKRQKSVRRARRGSCGSSPSCPRMSSCL